MHKICAHQYIYTVILTLPLTEGSKLQKDITEFKQDERAIKTNYPPSLKHYPFSSLTKNIILQLNKMTKNISWNY